MTNNGYIDKVPFESASYYRPYELVIIDRINEKQ